MGGDPRDAARADAESRSQGALAFVDAGALRRSRGARACVRALSQFVENRRREPWVLESLQYLNHPLREAHAQRFVRPALDSAARDSADRRHLLSDALDGFDARQGISSPEAAETVREFLAEQLSVSAAADVDDPHVGRRIVAGACWRSWCPAETGHHVLSSQRTLQLWTQSFGLPVPSSVPLMYQFLPSGS